MVFDLSGKVAIVTGEATGIGLECVKEFLRNGLKGVTLADEDPIFGRVALLQIKKEFGADKAIFVKTDVSNIKEFENVFTKTIDKFQNVDILVNNSKVLDDSAWEKEVSINMNGVIHGMLLGLDNYLTQYKQGPEAVILNVSSTCGVEGYAPLPVYCATQFAVMGMTKAWGTSYHYERTNVRVAAICPGVVNTPLVFDMGGRTLGAPYQKHFEKNSADWLIQDPQHVAIEMVKIIQASPPGSIWLVERDEPAYEYVYPDREKSEKKYIDVTTSLEQ